MNLYLLHHVMISKDPIPTVMNACYINFKNYVRRKEYVGS